MADELSVDEDQEESPCVLLLLLDVGIDLVEQVLHHRLVGHVEGGRLFLRLDEDLVLLSDFSSDEDVLFLGV